MRIIIHAVGRLKAGPERILAERYRERAAALGTRLGWNGVTITETAESRANSIDVRRDEEGARLVASLPDAARIAAFDETGETLTSAAFAAMLAQAREAAAPAFALLIGGTDGLGKAVLERARRRIAFGRLTLPHQLVRILVAEQIYRAATILAGHPYHRG